MCLEYDKKQRFSILKTIDADLKMLKVMIRISYQKKYINRELPLGFYRELNSDSCYRVSSKNGTQTE